MVVVNNRKGVWKIGHKIYLKVLWGYIKGCSTVQHMNDNLDRMLQY